MPKRRDYKDPARYAFASQKEAARQRGIPFLFSFEEWVSWWETQLGPDWLSKRGRHRGQYVMARKGDAGPYEPGNVRCLLCSENQMDAVRNGKSGAGWNQGTRGLPKKGNKLTDKQVLEIFRSKGPQREVAPRFGITQSTVGRIRSGKAFSWLTKNLRGDEL